ncbi:MAG TPA: hypothetical protein VGB63_01395 [Pedobacter sp.]
MGKSTPVIGRVSEDDIQENYKKVKGDIEELVKKGILILDTTRSMHDTDNNMKRQGNICEVDDFDERRIISM